MADSKKRPGEKRRKQRRARLKKAAVDFSRPIEWAQAELVGVVDWLERLKGPAGQQFPKGWRQGQLKHYRKRVTTLRAEIKASEVAAAALESEDATAPDVA